MKKILITGGAGYLGSLISTILLEKDYKITVLDNLMHKKNTLNHILEKNNFNFIKGDVRDSSLYKKLIKENDIILPLAGIVGTIQANEVVKEILKIGNTLCGQILIIDGLKLIFRKVKLNKRSDCYCNEKK